MSRVPQRSLPAGKRAVMWTLDRMYLLTEGYRSPWLSEVMHTYSLGQIFDFNRRVMKIVKSIENEIGPWQAQLAIAFSALWNGCEYCSRGHAYAANLLYFEKTGKLLPIDELEIGRLQRMKDEALLQLLHERLRGEELEVPLRVIERLHVLKFGGPVDEQPLDLLYRAVNATWDWLNECSVVSPNDPVPPLNSIAKRKAVIDAYHAARGRATPSRLY